MRNPLSRAAGYSVVELMIAAALLGAATLVLSTVLTHQSQDLQKVIQTAERDQGLGLLRRLSSDPAALLKSYQQASATTNSCLRTCLSGVASNGECNHLPGCQSIDATGQPIQENLTLFHPVTGARIGGYDDQNHQAFQFSTRGRLCDPASATQALCPIRSTLVVHPLCPMLASSCPKASSFILTLTLDWTGATTGRTRTVETFTLRCEDVMGRAPGACP